jgi:hypothetical protein
MIYLYIIFLTCKQTSEHELEQTEGESFIIGKAIVNKSIIMVWYVLAVATCDIV